MLPFLGDVGTPECDSLYEYPHDLDDEATRREPKRYPAAASPADLIKIQHLPLHIAEVINSDRLLEGTLNPGRRIIVTESDRRTVQRRT
jgi:hypothetical protein